MPLKLFKLNGSPPARAVMMMTEILGLPVEMQDVNFFEKEHTSPEYLKMNPLHTVPVLVDEVLVIHDSHAALMYLSDKYGKNDSLYPKDIKKRTLINQQLFFNNSILFTRLRNVTYPAMTAGPLKITQSQISDIVEAYGFVEEFLSRTKFLATDDMTIADIAAFATVSSLEHLVPIDEKFNKTKAWLTKMGSEPFASKANSNGLAEFGLLVQKFVLR